MRKTVLLTGGCGFIGSHITEEYLRQGYKVVILDNLSSGSINNIAGVKNDENLIFLNVDIRNASEVENAFEKYKPTIVNHHAAQKSVPFSVADPIYDVNENLIGLLNLLLSVKKYPVENFIYISSGGALSKDLVGLEKSKESDSPQLLSPYAITKYAGENYIKLYSKLFNFEYTILRYSNVYGPKQIKDGECGVIPIFVENIINNKPSTLMTYEDMPRGCTRDYIYVKDVVQANMMASEKPINETINISSAIEIGILDVYNYIQDVFEVSIPIRITGPRIGDVKRSVLSNEKAFLMLGWKPQTDLKDGIKAIKQQMKESHDKIEG